MQKRSKKFVGPMVSFIIHCLVILLAYLMIQTVIPTPKKDIRVELVNLSKATLGEVITTCWLPDTPGFKEDKFFPEKPTEPKLTINAPDLAIEESNVENVFERIDVPPSSFTIEGLSNRNKANRKELRNQFAKGYSGKTEEAVLAALEYLKSRQNDDGSWTQQKNHKAIGVTGLSLLTFLAHGETHRSAEYGLTVERAIRWLLKNQNEEGEFTKNTYAHSIATYALAESYAMTKIPKLREPLDKAISIIIDGLVTDKTKRIGSMIPVPGMDNQDDNQVTYARLEYSYNKETRMDTSVLGWNAQALKAAKMAGNKNPKLSIAITQVMNGLMVAQNRDNGKFMYSEAHPKGNDAMTGVGVLCLQLLGHGKSPEVKAGLRALHDLNVDLEKGKFYTYYYVTQAMFHEGNSNWTRWNRMFAPKFIKHQSDNGSFLDEDHHKVGPEYSTSLAALTLMVYYRNLPTFQEKAVIEKAEQVDDDVTITII